MVIMIKKIITNKQKDKTTEMKTLYKRECRKEKSYQYFYVMYMDLGASYRNIDFVTATS